MIPPEVEESSKEERLAAIRNKFRCISDCDSCGLCQIFKGRNPVDLYQDYIDGKCSFLEISRKIREG